jgi:predicted permease
VIDDAPYTVVGVMLPSFEFPRNSAMDRDVELWIPRRRPPPMMMMRGVRDLTVVARLRPGVDRAQAQREVAAISEHAESDNGQVNRGWRTRVVDLRDTIVGRVRPAIVMLGVCVTFLLSIACANASAATLARVTMRRQAFAVRLALGASNVQLIELVLAETIILALVAAAIALPLSATIRGVLVHLAPVAVPRQQGIVLDAVTLSFTALVAIVAAVATAFGPVKWLRHANVNALIADAGRTATGSHSRSRAIAIFVFGQLALATVLIAMTASLFGRFARINRVDPGFTPRNVVAATIPLRGMRYRDARSRARLTTQLLQRVRAIPGVEHAAVGTLMPMSGGLMSGTYATRDASLDSSATAVFRSVSSDFFQTLGIAIRQGRPIVSGDNEVAVPVAVVNEAFVHQTFGDRPAIGQLVRITPPGADSVESFEIVGVSGNAKEKDLLGPPSPIIYVSDQQASFPHTVLAVRSRGAAPLAAIRAAARDLDPSLALDDVTPLAARVRASYALQFFVLNILSAFALSAGILIGVGIYGSASYAVGADLKAIGVRMALGATRQRILWSVLSRMAAWSALGCAIGLVIAVTLGRVVNSVGVNVEPLTSVAGALAALVLAIGAAWLPAWRASGTDPLVVLRT